MNIYQKFCRYMADYDNWRYGYNHTLDEHCRFYINDPLFKVTVDVDTNLGIGDGRVDPAATRDYAWLGASTSAIANFQNGQPYGVLMNIRWIKIKLIYADQVIDELLGMRVDNDKADIAFPGYDHNTNTWYFKQIQDYDGLAYYASILLGEGAPSIGLNKTSPILVQII